jgi:putative restriction endonuclease
MNNTKVVLFICYLPLKKTTLDKLNQSAINDVLETEPIVRAEVLFKFLVEGKSHRKIEKEKQELVTNDGWSSWKIIHFFGFSDDDKGQFSNLDFKSLFKQIGGAELSDLAEYHLESKTEKEDNYNNSGKDILRNIKVRVGQSKLKSRLIKNYRNTCALCNISSTDLLIASHIKPWSKSNSEEKTKPENSILLCNHHDGLFDKGYISLNDEYELIFRDKKELEKQNIITNLIFKNPIRETPGTEFLNYHRKKNKLNK